MNKPSLTLWDAQDCVDEFHSKFNAPQNALRRVLSAQKYVLERPNDMAAKIELMQAREEFFCVGLQRCRLINEELGELMTAWFQVNTQEIADGLADLLYVVLGSCVAAGVNVAPIFMEVHQSNMSKTPGDFKPLKGPEFKLPNLPPLLQEQGLLSA